jgi:HK97 family phage major capsid protein
VSKILELKQQRATVAEQAKLLAKKQELEKRELNGEEEQSLDRMMNEIRGFNGQIKAIEQTENIDGMLRDQRDQTHREGGAPPEEQVKAFRSFLKFGHAGMTPEERTAMLPLRGSHNSPDFRTGNPQSDVTGNLGEYTVPVGFYARVILALKYFGGMLDAGSFVLETAQGNQLQIPMADDTSQSGAILAENTQVTVQEVTFSQVSLNAYKYTSKAVLIPIELLQDSGVDIEALIVNLMAIRIARILNTHFTSGDGSSKPRGVLLDSPTGITGGTGVAWSGGGASGTTGGFVYNDLVNLKYSVNRLYRIGAKWMMHDDTLAALLQLKDSNNRPLILDYLTTLQEDEPEKLLGQPIVVNNDMPTLGSVGSPLVGNQAVLYGQFSNYWIRRVMSMVMLRLVERYADFGQVGFIGFMRQDGKMVNAGQNPIKAFVSATS